MLSWREYNKECLIENLRNCDWSHFYDSNMNEKLDLIRSNLTGAVSPMVKKVKIKTNTHPKKWFDGDLMHLKKERDDIYKAWLQEKSESKWNEYVYLRNHYNKQIKEKKINYNRNEIIKANGDQKKMWKCLKNLQKYDRQ